MRALLRPLVAVAAGTLTATLVAAPATAKPTVVLTPGSLSRGPDIAGPHLDGKTVVDGTVRVRIKAPQVRLLGKSGSSYVVGTASKQGGHGRIYRVATDGTRTLLTKAHPYETLLSGDGATIVSTRLDRRAHATISVVDVTTATPVATKRFKGYFGALDAQADRVLIGSDTKTLIWTTSTGSVVTVVNDAGYTGDLSADVVATFTKDPYDGGCTVVRRISTGARLWRSCTEAVTAFSTDGSRIATTAILSDGPGPGRVDARTISGKHLGRYQVRSGWFGEIRFETPTALLLDVNGARKAFTARCTGTACERASDLRPAETLRSS
ncbi:MAG TPA: hypothetical protein VFV89_12840 [Nocardioides sp.]|uniref:hypothetical protein n=1 Tax=Nocardioides sp. TaxID=35761 RepID=UPI002E3758C0|nr:hypothetical protein [Nocardioides sp.]HEX5088690.1 hypothetical protein [Nocardioides sp.]